MIINAGRHVNLRTKAVELTHINHYSRRSGWFSFKISSGYAKSNWNDFAKAQSVLKGNKLFLYAGGNLTTQGAVLLANHDLSLSIGGHIQILANKYKKYNNVSRGSSGWFGLVSKDYDRTHEQVLVNGSGIESGNDLDIVSRNGDVVFQSASLKAKRNIAVDAQKGSILFLSEKASEYEQTKTYDSNGVWWKSRDKGFYNETTVHNHLIAGGAITFRASNGITVEYREGNANLDATIASLARSPELAWMLELKDRNDVQWQAIKITVTVY